MKTGFNIVAHLSSTSGLGNTARLFAEALESNGHSVSGFDVPYDSNYTKSDKLDISLSSRISQLPYSVNLIIISIQLLPTLWRSHPGLLEKRFTNIGLIFWEMPIIPSAWLPSLSLFDILMASSDYVKNTLTETLPSFPVVFAEHPIKVPLDIIDCKAMRDKIGISPDKYLIGCSFDLRSDLARKNPSAILDAFQNAFPTMTLSIYS